MSWRILLVCVAFAFCVGGRSVEAVPTPPQAKDGSANSSGKLLAAELDADKADQVKKTAPVTMVAQSPSTAAENNSGQDQRTVAPSAMDSHQPEHVAPSPANKEMLIAVVSSPLHFAARRAIRETYAKDALETGRITVKFFVGNLPEDIPDRAEVDKAISSEPDMVRFTDFTESYHNLSAKTIDIFAYGAENKFRTVFKVDDDTYVRPSMALKFFDDRGHDESMYAGLLVDGPKATMTDPKSKWYMYDQYPYDLEDYVNGPGVMLGKQALQFFADHKNDLFRYRVDDAAIAIWLKGFPITKYPMDVDHYSYALHNYSVYSNPVNANEMEMIHGGADITLKVCADTCLCWGGPQEEKPGCLTWDTFVNAGYQDIVPRAA